MRIIIPVIMCSIPVVLIGLLVMTSFVVGKLEELKRKKDESST